MLKIYGANLSAPSNKVRMTANVLGLSYEYIQVNIREGEHRSEWFLKLNPAGKVPAINDGGFVMFESGAIIKYLAAMENSSLYPDGIQKRALIDQWMDFVAIHIGGAMGRVLFNRVFASFAKVPPDDRSLADGLKFLERFLPVVDQQLETCKYLAGDDFTLADISLLATIDPAEAASVDIRPYAHLDKWRSALKKKDFYTQCHASYEEALRAMMAGSA